MARKSGPMAKADGVILPDAAESIHHLSLITGAWKDFMPVEQCKQMIADALNYCTCHHGLKITGYLVTTAKVSLILKIDKAEISNMLAIFYERMKMTIQKSINLPVNEKGERRKKKTLIMEPFEVAPSTNEVLLKLLTGRPANLPYYSPQLARLKDQLHNYNFCSTGDYLGAVGPVLLHGECDDNFDGKAVRT